MIRIELDAENFKFSIIKVYKGVFFINQFSSLDVWKFALSFFVALTGHLIKKEFSLFFFFSSVYFSPFSIFERSAEKSNYRFNQKKKKKENDENSNISTCTHTQTNMLTYCRKINQNSKNKNKNFQHLLAFVFFSCVVLIIFVVLFEF